MKRQIMRGVAVAVVLFSWPLQAQLVLGLNLEQLTGLAEKVFVGKCTSVKNETDSGGRQVQEVSFQVQEMLKGVPSETVTFRQLAPATEEVFPNADGTVTVQGLFRELPAYKVGEEAVIFLSEESRMGLTAPVGLLQGKFRIESSGAETKTVINGAGNKGLFVNSNKSPKFKAMNLTAPQKELLKAKSGAIPYGDFVNLVKALAQ